MRDYNDLGIILFIRRSYRQQVSITTLEDPCTDPLAASAPLPFSMPFLLLPVPPTLPLSYRILHPSNPLPTSSLPIFTGVQVYLQENFLNLQVLVSEFKHAFVTIFCTSVHIISSLKTP
jgi:hypothetical protein